MSAAASICLGVAVYVGGMVALAVVRRRERAAWERRSELQLAELEETRRQRDEAVEVVARMRLRELDE